MLNEVKMSDVHCTGKNPNATDVGGIVLNIAAFQIFRAIRMLESIHCVQSI